MNRPDARLDVIESVLTCTACELAAVGSGPVPLSGPSPNYLAIVGEAPGTTEDEKGQPFVGPAGDLLREALGDAAMPGLPTYMNTVSCFPGAGETPSRGHINACAHNLDMQLRLVNPSWVLLLGGVALSVLRSDLRISRMTRKVLLPPGTARRCFVTFHPAYALRNGKGEARMRADIKVLADMVRSGDRWEALTDDSCCVCTTDADTLGEHDEFLRFDDWNVPYCSSCWEVHSMPAKEANKEVKSNQRAQEKTGQLFASEAR